MRESHGEHCWKSADYHSPEHVRIGVAERAAIRIPRNAEKGQQGICKGKREPAEERTYNHARPERKRRYLSHLVILMPAEEFVHYTQTAYTDEI